jgi:hypothetical protein
MGENLNWREIRKDILGDLSEMIELALERAVQRITQQNGKPYTGFEAGRRFTRFYDVQEKEVPALVPVTRWSEFFDDPTQSGLRWMLWSNKEFRKAVVVKRGKRVLIDTAAYQNWLKTSGSEAVSARADRNYTHKRSSESEDQGTEETRSACDGKVND